MNIIYFKDLKLEDVIFISKAGIKDTKFKFVKDKANTCFVFPNEIITHQYFQSNTTNKELIKANLKNDFASIDPDLSTEIDVYETNLKNEYLLISNDNLNLIKNKLKNKITKSFFIWYLIKLSLVEVIHKHTKYSFDVHVLIHF